MKRTAAVFLAFFIAAAGACLYAQGSREYGESDTNIEVDAGEEFIIVLDSNQVLGLKWSLAEKLNRGILVLVDVKFRRATARILGIPGKETWRFRALKAGNTDISLEYGSFLKRNAPPEKQKTFKVTVKEPSRTK